MINRRSLMIGAAAVAVAPAAATALPARAFDEAACLAETLRYLEAVERELCALHRRHITALVQDLPHG